MRPLESLAMAFINTFGITRPSAAHLRRASWFIAGGLTLALIAVAAIGTVLYTLLRR